MYLQYNVIIEEQIMDENLGKDFKIQKKRTWWKVIFGSSNGSFFFSDTHKLNMNPDYLLSNSTKRHFLTAP